MTSSNEPSKTNGSLDKEGLYGWWHDSVKWQNKLHRKAAHKALDIEEDVGDINVTKNGLDLWPVVAAVGIGTAGFLGYQYINQDVAPTPDAPNVIEREMTETVNDIIVKPPEEAI